MRVEQVILGPAYGMDKLNLHGNRLTAFKDFDRTATLGMREIDLSGNRFSSFEAIQVFEFIEKLDVSSNALQRVDLRGFNTLELFVATNASLTELYAANAGQLLTIVARDNRLSSFANVSLPNKLRNLDLSFNALGNWSRFTPPRALRVLNASHNGATVSPLGTWSINDKLEVVDFSYNSFKSLTNMAWPNSLTDIDLRGNPIETIEIQTSDVPIFERLKSFLVDSNVSITCSGNKRATLKRLASGVNVCVVPVVDASLGETTTHGWALASILTSIICCIFLLVTIVLVKRQRRRKAPSRGGATAVKFPVRDSLRMLFSETHADPQLTAFLVTAQDWTMVRLLAKGPFAKVSLVRLGDKDVVMKKLRRKHALHDDDAVMRFVRELQVNASLEHRRLVPFLGFSWSTQLDLAMFCEYLSGGSLDTALRQANLSWQGDSASRCKLDIAVEVAEAVVYLHSYEPPVVHGHIRAHNVLVSESWTPKLSSVGVPFDVAAARARSSDVPWLAPEILRGDATELDTTADVFAFGVLLLELDNGETPPFGSATRQASLAQEIISGQTLIESLFRDDCPPDLLAIARACLHTDATQRPTVMKLFYDLSQLRRAWRSS
ncbi:hypothetical protein PINS_up009328 [Pythium insidiosum]|nr:hypothetical protein PINS_up009328 [Pythium insidiosum]